MIRQAVRLGRAAGLMVEASVTLIGYRLRFLRAFRAVWPATDGLDLSSGSAHRSSVYVGRFSVAVNRAAMLLLRREACLVKALTLRKMIRRRNADAQICLGTRQDGEGTLSAHAWVEYDGRVVMGGLPDLESFAELVPCGAERL